MRRSPVLAILAVVVAVLVIALGLSNGAPAPRTADLVQYAVSADGRHVVVSAVVPRQCDVERATANESATAVQIAVRLSCNGPSSGDAPLVDVPIALSSPLKDRDVLDANGAAVTPKS